MQEEDANYGETTLEEKLLIKSWPEVRVGFYNVGLLKSTVRGRKFGIKSLSMTCNVFSSRRTVTCCASASLVK